MSEQETKTNTATPEKKETATPTGKGGQRTRQGGGNRRGGQRRGRRRPQREAPEFAQKILNIRRVARVMAGGRRFSFSVSIVIGDKKGRVGVGLGKAGDTALAIEKAVKNAKRNMVTLSLNEARSIPYEVHAKFGASRVMLKPAPGRGLVAGSAVRSVLDMAGVTDVNGKILSRSKNQLNNARVTINALKQFGS